MERIYKYPRTKHLSGSKIQRGDEDLNKVSFQDIKNEFIVIEEKVDGANCGISFDNNGKMYLQSRGHFLNGGYGERQFDLFKAWANVYKNQFYNLLGDRYILYGEWLYAKHTVYYDKLTHYFMEFDIFDKKEEKFLCTGKRRKLLSKYKFIKSVLVLFKGRVSSISEIEKYIEVSNFKSENWKRNLEKTCDEMGLSFEIAIRQTDSSNNMEGLYIKVEDDSQVLTRCKYVRDTFTSTILDSETHWMDRPIIPNLLMDQIDIFTFEESGCKDVDRL